MAGVAEELLTFPAIRRTARFYWYNSIKFSYVLVAWSLALFLLSLRRPVTPHRRTVFRPAFVVGVVVLIDLCAKGLGYVAAVGFNGGANTLALQSAKMFVLIIGPIEVGMALSVVLALALLESRRISMTDWLDFAGSAVALLWILLGWASYLFRLTAL